MMLKPPTEFFPNTYLTLRPWSRSDAPALAAALHASEAHLRAWTPWVVDGRVPGLSLEQRLEKHAADFAAGTEWVYGIFGPNGEVLGGCGLYRRVGPRALEIGYWLAVNATGRGIATQASAVLMDIAFTDRDIEWVEMRIDPRNVASARVPQRLGFTLAETMLERGTELQVWRMSRGERDAAGAVSYSTSRESR